MKYTMLGRTGVQVSRLCLGCMNFGGRTQADDAENMIDHAIDEGINFIDTANVYGHEPGNYHEGRGRSEQIVGKVRYIGTSGFPAWKLIEALWVAKEYGLNRFISEQPPYHLLDRRIERELLPMAQNYGLGIITWAPLAGGFLTGKYKPDEPVPDNSRFSEFWRGFGKEHYRPSAFEVIEGLTAVAQAKNCSLAQLALAWQLHQPAITSPIIGPRTMAQLEDAVGAVAVELSQEDLFSIDQIVRPTQFAVPYYGSGDEDGIWAGWQPAQFTW